MANMSYCRFRNTLQDLQDCYTNMEGNEELSKEEEKARKELISLCDTICYEYGEES